MKPTCESEPANEAVNESVCPRCHHANSHGNKIGRPRRIAEDGVWEGKPYQIVEKTMTECEACGQIYFIKKYI
jgi:hypothetical protein